jgi:MYXO-CTERM domain-containing protein
VSLQPPEIFEQDSFHLSERFSPTVPLKPATTYTVTVTYQTYPPQTSTFTTASEDNLEPGTPPEIESLRLWRLRYPAQEIGPGNCTYREYVSFVEVRWKEGSVPNTPPGQILHLFSLVPKGGKAWRFATLNTGPKLGAEPVGDYPAQSTGWDIDLDPTREYCVSARALGDNDLVRDSGESNVVCATVEERSIAGASDAPGGNGGSGGGGGNGARGGSSGMGGFSGGPGNPAPDSSGCAAGGAPTSRAGGAGLLALLVLAGLRRRREA